MDYRIIDAHAHIFPDKIADKAAASICDFYGFQYTENAAVKTLLSDGENLNVTNYLVCSASVTAGQTKGINDYMAEVNKDEKFVALGTLHPDNEDFRDELSRIKGMGLNGIKIHSDFQHFILDDSRMIAICKEIAKESLPILFHMGDARSDGSSPKRLLNILKEVPNLITIAAHMGGYSAWDEAYEVLPVMDNLYFDTSSAISFMKDEDIFRMLNKHGTEKFLFGTDFPIWRIEDEAKRLLSLNLSEADNRAIFSENFIKLFKIK